MEIGRCQDFIPSAFTGRVHDGRVYEICKYVCVCVCIKNALHYVYCDQFVYGS